MKQEDELRRLAVPGRRYRWGAFVALALLACSASGCGESAAPAAPSAAPAAANSPAAPAAAAAPSPEPAVLRSRPAAAPFDAKLAPFVPPGCQFYVSVKNLDFYDPLLGGAQEARQLHEVRARLAVQPGAAAFAGWLREINDWLLERKQVQVSFVELFDGGFAAGADRPEKDATPEVTLVAAAGAKLAAFAAEFEKDEAKRSKVSRRPLDGGQLVTFERPGRRAVLAWHVGGGLLVASDDPARVEAALRRAKDPAAGFGSSQAYKSAVSRLDPDASVLAVADLSPVAAALASGALGSQGPLGATSAAPGSPEAMATAMAAQLQPRERATEFIQMLKSVSAQYVHQSSLPHVDVWAGFDTSSPMAAMLGGPAPEGPLRAPAMVSVNNPVFLAMTTRKPETAPAAEPQGPEAKRAETARQLRQTAAAMFGLNYETDVQPWLGRELAATVLWDARFPQLALMAAAEDAQACGRAMKTAMANFKGKVEFEERAVGEHKAQVAVVAGKPQVTPAYAVAGGFLILATGPQVLESLLDAPQKLRDNPGFASVFSVMGTDRVQYAGFFSTDLLERVAELSGPEFSAFQSQVQAACGKTLAGLDARKLELPEALCPAGGKYSQSKSGAVCSVHGTAAKPAPLPSESANPQLAAARQFKKLAASIAFGAAAVEPGVYRVSLVFRRK